MRSDKLIARPAPIRRNGREQSRDGGIVTASVNLQRTPAGSITVWVEAPNGAAGAIELDNLDKRNRGARCFVAWAEEQLGRNRSKRGARVELEPRNEGTFLRVKSRRNAGALNLDEIELDARVLRWAKAQLRPPARKGRPIKEWE
jgi:hypothetical protein